MRMVTKTILAGLVFALVAIAAQSQNPAAMQAAEAACGRTGANLQTASAASGGERPVPDGKAMVYVISNFYGYSVVLGVGVDGEWAGALRMKSYLAIPLAPGEHHFCVQAQGATGPDSVGLDELNVQAGGEYYLWANAGIFFRKKSANLVLRRVNADEGSLLVAQTPALRATALQAAEFACGPTGDRYQVDLGPGGGSMAPSSGEALIYFISQDETPYSGAIPRVGIDGHWIGAVRKKSYLVAHVEPGVHHFCVSRQGSKPGNGVALDFLNVKAGGVYYFLFECGEQDRDWGWRTAIDEVSSGEGKLLVAQSKLAVASPVPASTQ